MSSAALIPSAHASGSTPCARQYRTAAAALRRSARCRSRVASRWHSKHVTGCRPCDARPSPSWRTRSGAPHAQRAVIAPPRTGPPLPARPRMPARCKRPSRWRYRSLTCHALSSLRCARVAPESRKCARGRLRASLEAWERARRAPPREPTGRTCRIRPRHQRTESKPGTRPARPPRTRHRRTSNTCRTEPPNRRHCGHTSSYRPPAMAFARSLAARALARRAKRPHRRARTMSPRSHRAMRAASRQWSAHAR